MSLPSDLLPLLPAHVARTLACSTRAWDHPPLWRALWRAHVITNLDAESALKEMRPRKLMEAHVEWIKPIEDGTGDYLVAVDLNTILGNLNFHYLEPTLSITRRNATFVGRCMGSLVCSARAYVALSPRQDVILTHLRDEVDFRAAATFNVLPHAITGGLGRVIRFVDDDHLAIHLLSEGVTVRNWRTGEATYHITETPLHAWTPSRNGLWIFHRANSKEVWDFWKDGATLLYASNTGLSVARAGSLLCTLQGDDTVHVHGRGRLQGEFPILASPSGRLLVSCGERRVYDADRLELLLRFDVQSNQVAFDHGARALLLWTYVGVWRIPL